MWWSIFPQAKEQEVASLQLEVDELKMVQCRLEREKRFLREETQVRPAKICNHALRASCTPSTLIS